ncbi:MAG: glutamate-1-semialdehyde 2,1-aminomutase [Flavobacteriales bacterium]
MNYQRSSTLFRQAKKYIPGGVNSPVRAFKAVGGNPVFMARAKGARLYDADGNAYLDYVNSWGPMILGHARSEVIEAVVQATERGTSFGTPTELETAMARLAVEMIPNVDQIRMVNSGTEACMSALRLARAYTGRAKCIKFAGCYHGHADAFLIQAGSGALTFGESDSPGVTKGTVRDTLLARYNDMQSVRTVVQANRGEIAAVILEPVAGNMGCIAPRGDFLQDLRNLCDAEGILLIFDEVMTGFRLARGGAQELFGVVADITALGKVIGGGLPVGAFAARLEIMERLAPEGPVYQAGTLSGNPLAMAAGYATLSMLNTQPQIYQRINAQTQNLKAGLRQVLSRWGGPFQINAVGSMLSLHFSKEPVVDFDTACQADRLRFAKFFHDMLAAGIYLPPSGFESWFVCSALTDADVDETVSTAERILKAW